MAEFLTTSGTSHYIEKVIINAKTKLVLVSPYLKLSKTFYERIKDALERNVKVIIVYGKDDLKPNEKDSLAELEKIELYYFDNLHAKCYFNEATMVITSMNMYEFSLQNNREMGILIDRINDESIFNSAYNEVRSIIKSADPITFKKEKIAKENNSKKQEPKGFCIRCSERIPHDVKTPYCEDCLSVWEKFMNWDYEEEVCHTCGEYENTSMNKPECYDCYKGYGALF